MRSHTAHFSLSWQRAVQTAIVRINSLRLVHKTRAAQHLYMHNLQQPLWVMPDQPASL